MSSVTIHPRLFATASPSGQNIVISEGDSTVVTLYELYVNRLTNTTSWMYRKRVLQAALRLFGRMDEWLYTQSGNAHARGYNLEYIQDTLDFIRTGKRELSNETWIELLHEQDDVQQGALDARGPKSFFALKAGEDTPQLLQRWCAQPGGFQDLICTLHVLFGKSRRTLAR
jgi:hypothetical protein